MEGEAQAAALIEAPFWKHVTAIYPGTERRAILPAPYVALPLP